MCFSLLSVSQFRHGFSAFLALKEEYGNMATPIFPQLEIPREATDKNLPGPNSQFPGERTWAPPWGQVSPLVQLAIAREGGGHVIVTQLPGEVPKG